jgi:hypothetical protein
LGDWQCDTPKNVLNFCGPTRLGVGMSEQTIDRRLNSIADTLAQIPIGRTVLYELIDAGELQRVKIKHRTFITQASIDAYLAKIGA